VAHPAVDPEARRPVWGLAAAIGALLTAALLLESPVVTAEHARVEAITRAATARIVGRLAHLAVEEGATVKAGQCLATLEAGELTDEVQRYEGLLAAAEAGLPASRTAAALQATQRRATLEQAIASVSAAQADLTAAQARAAQADSTAAAQRAGRDRGVVGAQEVQAAEAEARACHAQTEAAVGRLRMAEAARDLAKRQAGIGTVEAAGLARSAADIRQAKAALAIARRRLAQVTVTSPVDGIIARRLLAEGDQVQPGQPVYTVLADGAAWIRADIREADVPAVRSGAAADIVIDAFPDRHWSGTVTRLGAVTDLPDAAAGRLSTTVSVMIRLDQAGQPSFIPGMTARVSIRRTGLGWWGNALAAMGRG
jgi:multidrug resistance efflux pump